MNKVSYIIAVAALVGLTSFAGNAQAYQIQSSSTLTGAPYTNSASGLTATYTTNAGLAAASNFDPSRPVGVSKSSSYYYANSTNGSVTLSAAAGQTISAITLDWGSINASNEILLYSGTTLVDTISASTSLSLLLGQSALVTLYSLTDITKLVFKNAASGIADGFQFAVTSVTTAAKTPLPAALPLFGLALAGLGVRSSKKKSAAK